MAIRKQEFYEGAALHILARAGRIANIRYEAPFFRLNGDVLVLLKYCTKSRSPWGFTFTHDEQAILRLKGDQHRTFIGLVCGSDGVVSIKYEDFLSVASPRMSSLHIACYRQHGKHYQVNGPDGGLLGKVAPSTWQRILEGSSKDDEPS